MTATNQRRVIKLIAKLGLVRPRDIEAHGVSRVQISRLVDEGFVLRQARGIYVVARHVEAAE